MTETTRTDYIASRGKTRQEWLRAKDQWVAELEERYRGIDASAGPSDVAEVASRFGELMREWNPIGCTVEDLKSVASARCKMPQKATYFYPKLLSGLVINVMKDGESIIVP